MDRTVGDDRTTITVSGMFEVDARDTSVEVDLEALRGLPGKLMPGGRHGWVIAVFHAIDDPERALDDMELTGESFVGLTPIHCLWCHARYDITVRFATCSQRPEAKESAPNGES
jgi:hypothetical protein